MSQSANGGGGGKKAAAIFHSRFCIGSLIFVLGSKEYINRINYNIEKTSLAAFSSFEFTFARGKREARRLLVVWSKSLQ